MEHLKFSGEDVEIIFSFDTTGRMYRAIQEVGSQIDIVVDRLLKDISIRMGVIAHGDYGDDELGNGCLSVQGLTSDGEAVKSFVRGARKTHGEDAAESYEYVLRSASQLTWRKGEGRKALVLIGDDVPHAPSHTNLALHWRDEALRLKALGVKIYAVQAHTSRHAKPFYSELANLTQGTYLNIKDFSLLPNLMLAICYKEASDAMLAAFVDELEASNKMDTLRPVLAPLLPSLKDTDYSHYANLLPLVANTAWWNPRLHDTENQKPAFVQDPHTRKFIKQEKKDGDISELSTAYARTNLENNNDLTTSIDFSVDDDQMDISSYPPIQVSNQSDNQPKKIRLDNVSPITPATPVDSVTNNNTRGARTTTTSIKRKGSRRLINDNDDDDGSTFEGFHFDFEPSDISSSSLSANTPSTSISNNNNDAPDTNVADSPGKRYQTRLTKGRPRRASSFAFGDVPPSTPFASMFASPSVLSETKKRVSRSPFDSPIEESGAHSDSETTRKRKATWDPPTLRPRPARIVVKTEGDNDKIETPRVGTMVAVRAQGGGFWLAKVSGFNGAEEVDVQWMDEIKSHHNFFVLLEWHDTISIRAIFKSRVKIDNMKKIGVYKLPESEKQLLESIR